ncbi:MAG: divergent polysaccharide deacetylase family protein [Reyranella sp.]|nr:divergent polysaccharide deacetylase family protein [Reyranella sp.]
MAAADREAGQQRGRGGLIAAYGLVLALIVTCTAVVLGIGGGASDAVGSAAPTGRDPESRPSHHTASLKIPPRPPPAFRSLPPAETAAMVEVTGDGLSLPRISPGGWMPWLAYARRFDPSGPPARIGLLVINVGVSEPLMQRAIEELPGEVSLAFLPGTPDLPRWLRLAREHGHESYLMLPVEDPGELAERGIRPIQTSADAAENLGRLRSVLARGEAYAGVVIPASGPVSQSEPTARPVVREIADRGLALIEVNPLSDSAVLQRLADELGAGYARSAKVLDYRLTGEGVAGNLDRLVAWVAESEPGQPPRHAFGVVQPDDEAIDAIVYWYKQRRPTAAVSLVPIIGHFECREACMARVRLQPAQLLP